MDLSGVLSNELLAGRLHCLTDDLRVQERKRPRSKPPFRYRDSKRRDGTVGAAVVAVLTESEGELKLGEIHQAVEQQLGGRVSLYSVQDYIRRHVDGPVALFKRPRYGHYALRDD